MNRALLLASTLLATALAQERATDNSFHTWLVYDGHHPIEESKWRLHLEGHWRRHDTIRKWQQLLLRPGISYAFTPHVSATFGYAFIDTWPYGFSATGRRFPEHRLWEQVQFSWRRGKAAWGSRVRLENRWLGIPAGEWRYENRLRVLQRVTRPVWKRTYVHVSNEVFFYAKPFAASSWFDQNRAYAGIGWILTNGWRLETGYMNQALLRRSGLVLESNHTLRLTLVSDAVFRR